MTAHRKSIMPQEQARTGLRRRTRQERDWIRVISTTLGEFFPPIRGSSALQQIRRPRCWLYCKRLSGRRLLREVGVPVDFEPQSAYIWM